MEGQIRDYLRQKRLGQRLSVRALAARSGVGRSTLSDWETGRFQPRLPELKAALKALGVSTTEQREALRLMQTPRVIRLARETTLQETHAQDERIGLAPCGGDLLRAMRVRQGRTLEEVAAQTGVHHTTLSRWERGESWPNAERLHALCLALKAREEEIVALTCGRFSLSRNEIHSQEEMEARFYTFVHRPYRLEEEGLKELRLLSLEAEAWPLARHNHRAQGLLGEMYAGHAHYLGVHGRFAEAQGYADRALETMPRNGPPERWWFYAIVTLARSTVYRGHLPAPMRGVETFRPWLSEITWPDLRAWAQADMAKYLAMAGEMESALSLAKKACLTAERGAAEVEQWNRRHDYAGLLVKAGLPNEALSVLPLGEFAFYSVEAAMMWLTWAEARLALGDLCGAHDAMQQAYVLIEKHDLPHERSVADALARQL
jgi:transcriptional regulator with XRE-family HTH domain